MGYAYYYLPLTDQVGLAVASVVEEDLRPIVGFDDALEVEQERSITAMVLVVGASEPPADTSLAAPLGQEEVPTFGAILTCQVCAPAPGVGEPDAIQRLQPQSTSPH